MNHRMLTRFSTVFMTALLLVMSLATVARAAPPGNEAFSRTWSRTDQPVLDGVAARTWMWGPEANTALVTEDYAESPLGARQVQYYDKARMEITDPSGDSNSIWYVTNGLLVVELITGKMQIGDNSFETRNPAMVNVAGDFDDPTGPTYATFGSLLDASPRAVGSTITERVQRDGTTSNDPALAAMDVTAGHLDEVTNHAIATPFWDFMNSNGIVYENGQYTNESLFESPLFATGRPITEAYWAEVKVGGVYKDVLMQCFERRCLTYTPGNPQGFIVEAGNVGQHYYNWRYNTENGNDGGNDGDGENEPPVETATRYEFEKAFGLPAQGIQISKPNDVAASPSGDAYMTDTTNHRILKFDSKGIFVTAWGSEGTGNGEFKAPRGIAVDSQGYVYVADKSVNRIQKFDPNGAFVRSFGTTGAGNGQLSSPHDIGIGPNDQIYVSDQGNNRVQVFDANGNYVSQFGSEGSANGQLKAPHGIDVSKGGLIYVADAGNDRIQLFDADGNWQGNIGKAGAGDGEFGSPMNVAVAGDGTVYATDVEFDRVAKFSILPVIAPTATTLQAVKYQFDGFLEGSFVDPTGADTDPSGRVLIADRGNDRIQIYANTNFAIGGPVKLVDSWTDDTRGRFSAGNPDGVAVGPDGRIYAVDNNQDVIKVFRADGEYLTQYGPTLGANVTLKTPLDLAIDSDGNLYVTDPDIDAVVKLTPNGALIAQFGSTGSGNGQFEFPSGIALDDEDNIYVADIVNKRIQKFAPNFSFVDSWSGTGAEAFNSPVGVAIHGDRIYVTDSGSADKVRVFDLDGEFIADWDGFEGPTGIATDTDGFVYVGDTVNPIQKFSPEGEMIARIGRLGTGNGEIKLDTAGPRIALDSAGNVYVGDPGNQRVQVFSPVE